MARSSTMHSQQRSSALKPSEVYRHPADTMVGMARVSAPVQGARQGDLKPILQRRALGSQALFSYVTGRLYYSAEYRQIRASTDASEANGSSNDSRNDMEGGYAGSCSLLVPAFERQCL